MAKIQNIELHNEEVREIMKEIPGSLLRWGLTIIFMIFASVIVGSYFFQFKEIVSAPIVITTTNPPAPIITKSSGRIARWFVSDGQHVDKGDDIALIKNSTNLNDFYQAEETVLGLDTTEMKNRPEFLMPGNLILGELQDSYNRLHNNLINYSDYLNNSFLPKKMELLRQQMLKQKQHYRLSLKQQKMMAQEHEITKNRLKRQQSLLTKGGVSVVQIEEAKAGVIRSERAYTGYIASLKSEEINLISQQRSLLELQEQHNKNLNQFEMDIENDIISLKAHLQSWREKYLLSSPISGTVTLTTFWSENHVVSVTDRIATVVPDNSSLVICRAIVPSTGIGKVKITQQANIKLAGFPYMEHGMLTGEVSTISLVPEKEGYIVEISLNEGMMSSYSEQLKLVQEMDGTADIIVDDMRMIYRFINPLKMLFDN